MKTEKFNLKKITLVSFLSVLFLISFFYRIYGLSTNNPPFWVDEFASANQAKLFLEQGLSAFFNPNMVLEHYNITTHFLIATSYKIFGVNEFAARFPLVIVGSMVPLVVFFLTRHLTSLPTAISAGLLTTFSYFEITWSRQARGYIILQFLVLLSFFLYLKLISLNKITPPMLFSFLVIIFLGIITHPLYYLFLVSIFIHFLFTSYKSLLYLLSKSWFYFLLLVLIFTVFKIGFIAALLRMLSLKMFLTNNFWYYHSFLWRDYGLLTFLAIIGFLILFFQKNKTTLSLFIYIAVHLVFVTFIFKPYVSRYLLPIFPFFLMGTSYALWYVFQYLPHRYDRTKVAIPIILTLFIIFNGHKFVNKPKKYYSLNHDFREIANVDYHQFYFLIRKEVEKGNNQIVVIETWWDRARWYLGEDFKNIIAFRWLDEGGYVNGLPKMILYSVRSDGEKILKGGSLRLVLEKKDLQLYLKKYPKGFLFIDDSSLPQDVQEYAQKNLKRQLYLDHYPLDDNPYSIWPATLYSWGI